ncbi:radical SAM protein [bacterium]|nr:radical SAM protein [bacterium]
MVLALKNTAIYGPVNSRRLGQSLGINVFKPQHKYCSFNCLYCQYGLSAPIDPDRVESEYFRPVSQIIQAVEQALQKLTEPPAFITFSGHGEPTLHPRFGELVEHVIEIRDRLCPQIRTAILSNSSTVGRPEVVQALNRLDLRIMKLDAGNEQTFLLFNRPAASLSLEAITAGLTGLDQVTIQTLIAGGEPGNDTEQNLTDWIERLKLIRPSAVQVYSLDRETAVPQLVKLNRQNLQNIEQKCKQAGLTVEIY